MAGFSPETLQRIQTILNTIPDRDPNFRIGLSANCLWVSFGYGEKIEIDANYLCVIYSERSCRTKVFPDEETSAAAFIKYAKARKSFL